MLSLVVYVIPYVLGIVLVMSLIGIYTHFRRARQAPYFRIRQDAARRGWRLVLLVLVLAAGIGGAITARRAIPPPDLATILPARPTPTPAGNVNVIPTVTPDPDLTPKNPLEGPPTITPTQPTPTLAPTPVISTVESLVTPPFNAVLRITAISSEISASRTPANAGETFSAGIPRVYVWFEFSDMVNGISWSRVLLWNGEVVRSESEVWTYGAESTAYHWFEAQGGWPAGQYEIRFYLGDKLVSSETFELVN